MFTVDTEEEAEELLVLACPRNLNGEFIARELATEQSLENLEKFAQKLETCYVELQERKKRK